MTHAKDALKNDRVEVFSTLIASKNPMHMQV